MTSGVVTIGVALIKMGVLGGVGVAIVTGVKWFGKFEPTLKGKSARGGSESDNVGESLRKRLAERS
jgi:hypothetical protein